MTIQYVAVCSSDNVKEQVMCKITAGTVHESSRELQVPLYYVPDES